MPVKEIATENGDRIIYDLDPEFTADSPLGDVTYGVVIDAHNNITGRIMGSPSKADQTRSCILEGENYHIYAVDPPFKLGEDKSLWFVLGLAGEALWNEIRALNQQPESRRHAESFIKDSENTSGRSR